MISRITNLFKAAPARGGPTLSEVFTLFYASRLELNLRPWTLSHWRWFGGRLARTIGSKEIKSLSRADLVEIHNTYGKAYMEFLRPIINWAHDAEIIEANPLPKRKLPPREDAKRPTYLHPHEAHALYNAAEDHFKPALALALWGGLRPMEICRMDWANVNIKQQRIRIEAGMSKVRRGRIIENVPTILWAQLAIFEKSSGPFIPGSTDLSRYEMWNKIRKRTADRVFIKLPPNVFRHSFATFFTALTGNPAKTARVLGHTKLDKLAQYYDGLESYDQATDYFHPKPILALPWKEETP